MRNLLGSMPYNCLSLLRHHQFELAYRVDSQSTSMFIVKDDFTCMKGNSLRLSCTEFKYCSSNLLKILLLLLYVILLFRLHSTLTCLRLSQCALITDTGVIAVVRGRVHFSPYFFYI